MAETAEQRAVRIAKLKSDLANFDRLNAPEPETHGVSNIPNKYTGSATEVGFNPSEISFESHPDTTGQNIVDYYKDLWAKQNPSRSDTPSELLHMAKFAAPAAPIEPPHGFHGNAVDTLPIFAQKSVNNQPGAGVSGMNLLSDAQQATSAANPQFNLNPNAYQGNASTQWSSPVAQLAPSVAPALAVARQATAAPVQTAAAPVTQNAAPAAPQAAPAQTPAEAPAPQAAAPDARQETPESLWETYNQSNSPADFLRASNASQGNFAHGGSVPDDHPIVQRAMHLVRNFLMNG